MTRRAFWALAIVLSLAAAACGDGVPDEYTLLEEPFVAPPREPGGCVFPYQSQVALIDPATGAITGVREVPWTFEIGASGDLLLLGHDDTAQPSGALALRADLEIEWQSQFPGRLNPQGASLLEEGRILLWGRLDNESNRLIIADAATGALLMQTDTLWLERQPVELSDTLISTSDGAIGFDSATGDQLWQVDVGPTYPASVLQAADLLFIGDRDGTVTAVDSKGATRHSADSGLTRLDEILAVVGETVFVVGRAPEGGRTLVAIDMSASDILWSRAAAEGATVLGDLLVFPQRRTGIRAVGLESGEPVWQFYRDTAKVRSLAATDSLAVAVLNPKNGAFTLAAFNREPEDGPRWERLLEGEPTLGPEPFGGLVLVGGHPLNYSFAGDVDELRQGWLSAYSLDSGELIWTTILREPPRDLVEIDDRIAVLTADPDVFCD